MILVKILFLSFLDENKKLFAYPFKGYWKDVGTVKSLWEANMDLLDENCELDLFDHNGEFILLIRINDHNIFHLKLK